MNQNGLTHIDELLADHLEAAPSEIRLEEPPSRLRLEATKKPSGNHLTIPTDNASFLSGTQADVSQSQIMVKQSSSTSLPRLITKKPSMMRQMSENVF